MIIKDLIFHQLILSKRQIIIYFLVMALAFASIPTVFSTIFNHGNPVNYEASGILPFTTLLAGIIFGAVNLFKPFEKKSTSIQYVMLPANNIEKYLTGMLFNTFGTLLLIIISLVCADAIQALYNLAMSNDVHSMTISTFNRIKNLLLYKDGTSSTWGWIFVIIVLVIASHAIYTFVGSFYRKHAFLKSFATVNVVSLALISLLPISLYYLEKYLSGTLTIHFLIDHGILAHLIVLAFIAFCYWWSYRRFCRKAIV